MTDILKTVLGTDYCMFYHPAVPAEQLTPVQTLEQCCVVVNQALALHGTELSGWPAGLQDEIARLLWVNKFYQDLDKEPIRKPILVHRHQDQYLVDCGDTRLMTLQLANTAATVGVVVTCLATAADQYTAWYPVTSDQDLIQLIQFDPVNTTVLVTPTPPGSTYAVEWLEIGDASTSHHLHSIDLRIGMMQQYLRTQPANFKFTRDWAKRPIDWSAFA
jgi:hypothetical protein